MNVFVLSDSASIASQFLSELRDVSVQRDRMRFRRNMERLGQVLAYELSRKLAYQSDSVKTPLGTCATDKLTEQPVLITILRAGIPFYQGVLSYFDHADSGFIGAYRNEAGTELSVNIDYLSIPSIENRTVILIDPMLATGKSVVDAQRLLLKKGKPSHLHILSVVAAPEGISLLKKELEPPCSLWTCAVDEKLNSQFYIVPGLGDAGDLSYGVKAREI